MGGRKRDSRSLKNSNIKKGIGEAAKQRRAGLNNVRAETGKAVTEPKLQEHNRTQIKKKKRGKGSKEI